MFFSDRYYMVLGAGYGDIDVVSLRWWHTLVTPFVHGGGWPGAAAHLLINCALFIFLGGMVERLLGAGRFFLVTGTSLGIQMVLKEILVDGRAHGASGMTWSYLLFVGLVFVVLCIYAAVFQAWAWMTPGMEHGASESAGLVDLAGNTVLLVLLWAVVGFLVYYLRRLAIENGRVRRMYK